MPVIQRYAGVSGALAALVLTASSVAISSAKADDCSGLLCLFHARQAAPPQPAAAPPTSAGPEALAPGATSEAAAEPAPKAKPKPVPVVTIAADRTEIARLKPLAALMSRPRVRLVEARGGRDLAGQGADFAIGTSLDQGRGPERVRLFPEAMHVLAGDKVRSLDDLAGKTVSFGADGGASQAVARKAFEAAGVKVSETPLDLDNALDGLASGDIDAVVLVAPQPDARLAKLHGPGLHLVAWPQTATLPDGASATAIDAATYPGLAKAGETIAALGVDAMLVASPKGQRQPAAKAFLGALGQHAAALGKRGFALLKIDLDARIGRRVANNEPR